MGLKKRYLKHLAKQGFVKDIGKVARGALKPVHEREDGSPRPLEQGISILPGIAWQAPRVRVVCRCGNASVLLENDCRNLS